MPRSYTLSAFTTRLPSSNTSQSHDTKRDWSSTLRSRTLWSRLSSYTDTSSSTSSQSPSPRTKVYVSDSELRARAHTVAAELDYKALTDVSQSKWVWQQSRKELSLYHSAVSSEYSSQVVVPEILLTGDLNCSVAEVAAVLASRNEADVNASMKALYKHEFIYGALVHSVPLGGSRRDVDDDKCSSSLASSYVAVKTSTFVRSSLLGRNEEWCYLEAFEGSASGESLVVSQTSVPPSELGAGKAPAHARVDQLRDLSTVFLVERIPRTRSVRLAFYGKVEVDDTPVMLAAPAPGSHTRGVASRKATAVRLQMLAKGVSRIPEIVRRRRVGIQTLASRAALNATKNSRCTCCTRSLRFVVRKQRCHLCAYSVCGKCCSLEAMETVNGHVTSIVLCARCVECIHACEYEGISACSRRAIRVELDFDASASSRTKAHVSVLKTALLQDLGSPDSAAAAAVIKHMVQSDARVSCSSSRTSSETSSVGSDKTVNTKTSHAPLMSSETSQNELLRLAETTLASTAASPPPIEECVLANATSRSYPIFVPATPATSVPDYPLPRNEAKRLDVIHADGLLDLGEVTELNIICSLAAQELQCAISMVTVIDKDDELILSCNASFLHRTKMPRNQTFCSHLLMDDKPLLIRHPEADVRFHTMDAVVTHGIRFYCGFPITARDGTIVGSVCCLDTEQRALTQSQYAMMTTLARTASSVVQSKSEALRMQASALDGRQ